MHRRLVVGSVMTTALLLGSQTIRVRGAAPPAIPSVTIAGVPASGPCCLIRVEKIGKGVRKTDHQTRNVCAGNQVMTHSHATLHLDLASGPCNAAGGFLPGAARLDADGTLIRRTSDGFADFFGKFQIIAGGAVLFVGMMETIDRIGTHGPPPLGTEPCNPKEHFEGWLVGRGSGAAANSTMRAILAAQVVSSGPFGDANLPRVTINGTFVRCP